MHFREHIISTAKKCTTLIHTLAHSAKLSWGLKQEALNTIYKGAILPLMLYGAPVWIKAMEKNCNRTLCNRVQRIMNIKIAEAYRTSSNDALCVITGNTPIEMKAEEAANIYRITKDKKNQLLDHENEPQEWTPPPADTVRIDDQNELTDHSIHIYTDGSKREHGVGSGIAICIKSELTYQIKHKIHNRCSNNQAEQTAIIKALRALHTIKLSNNTPPTVKIFTESKITLSALKNPKNRTHLIEEIRKKTTALEK